jgi:acetate---CoA ligase (ADP-forming)
MTDNSLIPFFAPQGVAVVGASQNPTKLGYGLARNLIQCNYQGVVHFINPKGGILLGRPIYSKIADVPDPVDLAILLIPAPAVPQALRESGERGIRAAIIASGGFRETDEQGAALEDDCLGSFRPDQQMPIFVFSFSSGLIPFFAPQGVSCILSIQKAASC